jgi:hypothetical protein
MNAKHAFVHSPVREEYHMAKAKGATMRHPCVDDVVQLANDLPELMLACGELGVVRSIWCAPARADEVEFHPAAASTPTRVLLMMEQVRLCGRSHDEF